MGSTRFRSLALIPPLAILFVIVGGGIASTRTQSIDLRFEPKASLRGGSLVAGVGDINGDGSPDITVGDCLTNEFAGIVWVVFGPLEHGQLDLTDEEAMEDRGFRIEGARPSNGNFEGDRACHSTGAGDVNGDGLDDVLIGAPSAGNPGRSSSGIAYVVFGKTDADVVSLSDFNDGTQGMSGFRIDGAAQRDMLGGPGNLAGLEDINADGLGDLALGAPFAGSVYVLFGKTDPLPIDLLEFEAGPAGPRGFRIDTPIPGENDGLAVGAAGDANGDAIPDIIVGFNSNSLAGAFIVFGKVDSLPVDIRELGDSGYRIAPVAGDKSAGASVAGLGDVNGDGLSDVVVGAPSLFRYRWVDGEEQVASIGSAFIVFGQSQTATIRLGKLAEDGFEIVGASKTVPVNGTAERVVAAGDFNGDAVPDALISASRSTHNGRKLSGSAYVVFGRKGTTKVHLRNLSHRGVRIDGPWRGWLVGGYVAGSENIFGSELDDVLLSSRRGVVFVVSGRAKQ